MHYQEAIGRDLGEMKSRITIRNDVIQQLVYDTFDMLVNDLTSFCEGMTQKGGLLEKMKKATHHFKPKTAEDGDKSSAVSSELPIALGQTEEASWRANDLEQYLLRGHRTVFNSLFPGAAHRPGSVVTKKDINLLVVRFKTLYKKVKTYRDAVSAHRYERGEKNVESPTLGEVRTLLDEVENLMNQIRIILLDSSLAYHCFFRWNTEGTASDLLDLAVCGSSSDVRESFGLSEDQSGKYFWQLREAYYATVRKSDNG